MDLCPWAEEKYAAIAQLVEQGTENPCVLGSIPSCGTILKDNKDKVLSLVFLFLYWKA